MKMNNLQEKKMVRKEHEATWETDITQRDSIKDILECLEVIKSKYGEGVEINFETERYDSMTTTFITNQLETDQQFENRMRLIKEREEREQKEYLRLKAKFETK